MIAERLTTYTEEVAKERTIEMAKNLLQLDVEIEKIVKATGLSLENVLELKKEI